LLQHPLVRARRRQTLFLPSPTTDDDRQCRPWPTTPPPPPLRLLPASFHSNPRPGQIAVSSANSSSSSRSSTPRGRPTGRAPSAYDAGQRALLSSLHHLLRRPSIGSPRLGPPRLLSLSLSPAPLHFRPGGSSAATLPSTSCSQTRLQQLRLRTSLLSCSAQGPRGFAAPAGGKPAAGRWS
jgi:hypothetical protein